MNLHKAVAANRNNPRAALRAMWQPQYITINERTRLATLPLNGRQVALQVVNYANGITVEYKWNKTPLTFSHQTDARSIAATFGLTEHVDVITEMINFDKPAADYLVERLPQVANYEEQY